MASLWKHPKSPYWTACFTARDGRQLKRSTKTKDRKLAMKLAEQFEAASRAQQTAKQARMVLSDLYRSLTGEGLATKSFREYTEDWLDKKSLETSQATMKFYRYCTEKFTIWLKDQADKDIATLGRDKILEFRNFEAKTLAPKTVNHNLKCLKMLFRSAKRDGFLPEDPSEHVDCIRQKPRDEESLRRAFALEELQLVLSHCDDEWKSMVLFGFYTGQRLGDIARLKWGQVDVPAGVLRLVTGKTGRRMQIPIAAPLLKEINNRNVDPRRSQEEPIHPRAFKIANKNGTGHLSGQFSEVLAKAGLRQKQPHRSTGNPRILNSLSFHSLRYTATTMLQSAGVAAGISQQFIGHDSEAIHQHYARFGMDSLEKAAAALPDIAGV